MQSDVPDAASPDEKPLVLSYSPEEKTLLKMGIEAFEKSSVSQNEFLQRMLTLVSALIGGGFLIAKGDIIPLGWSVAALGCLAMSLSATLWGLMPMEGRFNIFAAGGIDAFRQFERSLAERKNTATKGAAGGLILAVIFALVGLMTKLPG